MPNKQEQAVADGSIALQADQIKDVIINNGVQIADIIPICRQIYDLNFPRLREEAARVALENVNSFSTALQASLSQNIEGVLLEKLADPDMQFCLNQSLQLVARHGEKIKPELLINLIQAKMAEDTNDFQNLICNQAINVLDKITIKHLHLIFFVGLVNNSLPHISLGHGALDVDDSFLIDIIKKIDKLFCNFYSKFDRCLELEYSDSKYLESLGIFNYDNMPFSYSRANSNMRCDSLKSLMIINKLSKFL